MKKIFPFLVIAMIACMLSSCKEEVDLNSVSGLAASQTDSSSSETSGSSSIQSESTKDTFVYTKPTEITAPDITQIAPVEGYDETEASEKSNIELDSDTIVGDWVPVSCVSLADGKETSLTDAFGKAFANYGGMLTFNYDGTFYIYIGASKANDSNTGKYTLNGSNIDITYNDGTKAEFRYAENNFQHTVYVDYMGYTVAFAG